MAKGKNKKRVEKAEDVEFSSELADSDDLKAMERMKKADNRAEKRK